MTHWPFKDQVRTRHLAEVLTGADSQPRPPSRIPPLKKDAERGNQVVGRDTLHGHRLEVHHMKCFECENQARPRSNYCAACWSRMTQPLVESLIEKVVAWLGRSTLRVG